MVNGKIAEGKPKSVSVVCVKRLNNDRFLKCCTDRRSRVIIHISHGFEGGIPEYQP